MTDPPVAYRRAGFWTRGAAIWIDILTIYVVLKAIAMVLEQFGVFDHFEYIAVLCVIAYVALFIGGKGRTIGKMLCGLTVRRTNGEPVGYPRVLLRETVGKCIACITLLLGFFWAGLFRSKRGWHDYIARTIVEQDLRAVKRGRVFLATAIAMTFLLMASTVGLFLLNAKSLQKRNVLKPGAIEVSGLRESDYEPFVTYLEEHGRPPVDYVVGKFQQHDVVILGEYHRVREVCEFVSELIYPLYHQAGVRLLAMEVFKYKNMALANELVAGQTYDSELALRLMRDCGFPEWGYQEYIDILKAVWQVNRALPPDAERFEIICLESDWDAAGLRSGQPLWRFPGSLYRTATRDRFMAKIVNRKVLGKGKKALVHVGGHHDFTRYRQPIVRNGKLVAEVPPRFGYILHEKYGNRVFQVCLHPRRPLGDFLDNVLAANGNVPVAFDVDGSPFAPLRDDTGYLFEHQQYVVFSDVAQGYVFLKPIGQLNWVTWAKGFVNEDNYEVLRDFLWRRDWITEEQRPNPKELNEYMKRWHEDEMDGSGP